MDQPRQRHALSKRYFQRCSASHKASLGRDAPRKLSRLSRVNLWGRSLQLETSATHKRFFPHAVVANHHPHHPYRFAAQSFLAIQEVFDTMAIMRVLCAAIALVQAVSGQNCNADNCLRAVRATNMGIKGATDCAAFFRATVTPSTM